MSHIGTLVMNCFIYMNVVRTVMENTSIKIGSYDALPRRWQWYNAESSDAKRTIRIRALVHVLHTAGHFNINSEHQSWLYIALITAMLRRPDVKPLSKRSRYDGLVVIGLYVLPTLSLINKYIHYISFLFWLHMLDCPSHHAEKTQLSRRKQMRI